MRIGRLDLPSVEWKHMRYMLLNAVRRRAKHLLALLGGLLWGHTLCMHETLLDLLTACLNSSSGHCVS